jgi:hypothetical protein
MLYLLQNNLLFFVIVYEIIGIILLFFSSRLAAILKKICIYFYRSIGIDIYQENPTTYLSKVAHYNYYMIPILCKIIPAFIMVFGILFYFVAKNV